MASRLLTDKVSESDKLPVLSADALNLFFLLIPHLSVHGKSLGDPHYVKGKVCPKFKRFTPAKIEKCLKEISDKTNVKWFRSNGIWYLHSLNYDEHQPNLRKDRSGKDTLPDYPGEKIQPIESIELPEDSGTTPGLLQVRKEEVGSRNEEEEVGSRKGVPGVNPGTRNLTDEEFLKALKDNPAYKHIDLEVELGKMDAWLLTPKGRGRQKTRRYIVNWLNKIDRPLEKGPPAANQAAKEQREREAAERMKKLKEQQGRGP